MPINNIQQFRVRFSFVNESSVNGEPFEYSDNTMYFTITPRLEQGERTYTKTLANPLKYYLEKLALPKHRTVYSVSAMIKVTDNKEVKETVLAGLKRNKEKYGKKYCPCSLVRDEDTVCMCKEFREMEEGTCHCQLYVKTKD